jgi:hypothetical protein
MRRLSFALVSQFLVVITRDYVTVLTIYAPMIYTAPRIMFWMRATRAYPLRGEWEGVGPWNSRVFGPCEMASSYKIATLRQ